MKLLHLADLHIGRTLNKVSLLEDQRYALSQVLDLAKAHQIDALLLAGDIYDKSTPSAEAVALLDWFLTAIAQAGLVCYAVPGNHDSAERVSYLQGPLKALGINLAPLFDGRLFSLKARDEHGPITFWLLPFVKPATVRRFFPDEDFGTSYTKAIAAIVNSANVDTSQRNILVAHQFVTSASQEPDRSDSEISVGGTDNVDVSVFLPFDYVALGHIHRPQRIGRDTVRYAGSLLKYSASEAKHLKGVTLVTVGPKPDGASVGDCVSIEHLPLTPLRDLRTIEGTLEELTSPDKQVEENRTDYICATLTDMQPQLNPLERMRAVYPNLLELRHRLDEADLRDEWEESLDVDGLDPQALFERFFAQQTGHELSSGQRDIVAAHLERLCESAALSSSRHQNGGAR